MPCARRRLVAVSVVAVARFWRPERTCGSHRSFAGREATAPGLYCDRAVGSAVLTALR